MVEVKWQRVKDVLGCVQDLSERGSHKNLSHEHLSIDKDGVRRVREVSTPDIRWGGHPEAERVF